MYLLTSNTESCDEDDGEVGECPVEEELADNQDHKWYIVRYIAINSLAISDEMWFLTLIQCMKTHDPCRVSPRKAQRKFL